MGTVINVLGIILGGISGLIFGKFLKEYIRDALTKATGIAVMFVGITGALEQMAVIENHHVTFQGTMMMIISLAIGVCIGEILQIENRFTQFGEWIKHKSGNQNDARFVSRFVSASLTVCIGAMAIVGAMSDGMRGDHTVLFTKAILDFLIIMVMTTSFGKGCIFSCIPVGIWQGSITILASVLTIFVTETAITNLSIVGSVLIFCVGVNLIWQNTFRVANMLPGVIVALIWGLFL